mgnify:CR=1 FL=1
MKGWNVMGDWTSIFELDPVQSLLNSKQDAITYFAKRDLIEASEVPLQKIWELIEPRKILNRQKPDGTWRYPKKITDKSCGVNYTLIETWKQLRVLIQQYEFSKEHDSIKAAADYIFSCQTLDGDIRGMLANQHAPYYTGAIMYLLIKAGYVHDERIHKCFNWLLKMRQDDGGWVIGSPGIVTREDLSNNEVNELTYDIQRKTLKCFDASKPFSAAGTGMVLRAFAEHPTYQHSTESLQAGKLLKSKLLEKDNWSSYQHPDNWLRFQYPFWWTNLVSAMDTLSLLGFGKDDPDINRAIQWFITHQEDDGLWNVSYSRIHKNRKNRKTELLREWVSLSICRFFKRLYK